MNEKKRRNINTNDNIQKSSSINVILGDVDYILLVTILTLVFFGIMMVFSASMYTAGNSAKFGYDTYYFLKRHFVYAIIGIISMLFTSNLNYNYLKYGIPRLMYIVSVVLLIVIYLPLGFSMSANGATRWFIIPGTPISFQPSDIAKATIMIWVPASISKNINLLLDNKEFGFFCLKILFLVVLVGKENLSTAIIMIVISFGIIFISSPYTLRFITAGVMGVSSIVAYLAYSAFFSKEGFRGGRFLAWLDPFADANAKGFQTIQGLYAISSGGLFGLGFGKSRQKLNFIPEAHNDIIFAIICEELGLFGAIMVIFLFGLLIFRGIKIAVNAPNIFGSLTAAGIVIFIATQTIINISVVTNTIPNTGIALPFISYGGTALIITLALMGILLNISRYTTVNRS